MVRMKSDQRVDYQVFSVSAGGPIEFRGRDSKARFKYGIVWSYGVQTQLPLQHRLQSNNGTKLMSWWPQAEAAKLPCCLCCCCCCCCCWYRLVTRRLEICRRDLANAWRWNFSVFSIISGTKSLGWPRLYSIIKWGIWSTLVSSDERLGFSISAVCSSLE